MNNFRVWLSQELKQRHLSQRELARQAGVSSPLVVRVLSGDMPASADFCIKVAAVLNINPIDTLIMADIFPSDVILPLSQDDPLAQELLNIFAQLTPLQRQNLLEFARFLQSKTK